MKPKVPVSRVGNDSQLTTHVLPSLDNSKSNLVSAKKKLGFFGSDDSDSDRDVFKGSKKPPTKKEYPSDTTSATIVNVV